ncbi:MAG: uncharacterized protein A8A55_1181 [Amphiamblys sp. WSBS2006]|nr:MAG: uncharacterized protein A8A55_1181 [Amphiamblys sp. WSBS2006]
MGTDFFTEYFSKRFLQTRKSLERKECGAGNKDSLFMKVLCDIELATRSQEGVSSIHDAVRVFGKVKERIPVYAEETLARALKKLLKVEALSAADEATEGVFGFSIGRPEVNLQRGWIDMLGGRHEWVERYIQSAREKWASGKRFAVLFLVQFDFLCGLHYDRKGEAEKAVFYYSRNVQLLGKIDESYSTENVFNDIFVSCLYRQFHICSSLEKEDALFSAYVLRHCVAEAELPRAVAVFCICELFSDELWERVRLRCLNSVESSHRVSVLGKKEKRIAQDSPRERAEELSVWYRALFLYGDIGEDTFLLQQTLSFYTRHRFVSNAVTVAKKTVAMSSALIGTHERLFLVLYGAGRVEEAFVIGKKCMKLGPTDYFFCLSFGKMLIDCFGDGASAEGVLRHGKALVERSSAASEDGVYQKFQHMLSVAVFIQKREEEGIQTLEGLLKEGEASFEMLHTLAVFYGETGRWGRAKEAVEGALSICAGNAFLSELFVECLVANDSNDAALGFLLECTESFPWKNIRLLLLHAELLAEAGEYDKAASGLQDLLGVVERVFGKRGKTKRGERGAGREIASVGFQRADMLLEGALFPPDAVPYGRFTSSLLHTPKSLEKYTKAEVNALVARILVELGRTKILAGEEREAAVYLREAEEIDFFSWELQLVFSFLEKKAGRPEQRKERLHRAYFFGPENDAVLLEMARMYLEDKERESDIIAEKFLLQMESMCRQGCILMGEIADRRGDAEKKAASLKRGVMKQEMFLKHRPGVYFCF